MDAASLPETFFQGLSLEDAIIANIKASIQAKYSLPQALRRAQLSPDVDQSSRQRLLQCAEVVEICGSDTQACVFLLKDQEIKSISDIARKYYCTRQETPCTTEIRNNLLYRVPTAVLRAVVDLGILPLAPPILKSLSSVLKLAVEEKFDIRSGSLGKFIGGPACLSELSNISADDAAGVRRVLETLYRLHSLVVDAEDLKYLVDTRFTSARVIAATNQDEFNDEMEHRGLVFQKSAKIYLEATRIDRRNEAFWADVIRSRREVPVLAITGRNERISSGDPEPISTNLSTLFQDLDSVATENSTSVLSPASYLVDLLQLLSQVSLTIPAVRVVEKATTALDVLLYRRPDIAAIKLSKEDTETPMAYMDLAIEVMEKYIGKVLSTKDSTQNQDKQSIYAAVSQELAPMNVFPYNNAIASSREFLQARGYTRYELLRRFQSDRDLAKRAFPGVPSNERECLAAARNTHERRLSVESLGLQPLDFQAITQEDYHTRPFIRLLQDQKSDLAAKTYAAVVGLQMSGEYWGYQSEADPRTATWKMLDPQSTTSLRLVKDQVLVRSGLSPSQLNTVLKTRYIGNRLVQTLVKVVEFSDRLQDMRLQESLLVNSTGEPGSLSERTCLDLQAFLRLRYRLGWSTETLDAAIAALAQRSRVYPEDSYRHFILDGEFVDRLAAAQQLSIETGVPLVELLPFWGPMDAQFPTSLYAKLFLAPGLVAQYPSLKLIRGDVTPGAVFGQHMAAVIQALRMIQADLLIFMKVLAFDAKTPWTLSNIAQLYSHQKMCKILDLPVKRYADWWALVQSLGNPLLDPQSSRTALTPWLALHEKFESAEAALDLLTPPPGERELAAVDLSALSQILQALAGVESWADALLAKVTDIEAAQVYSSEVFLSLCSRMFSPIMSKAMIEMVEGRSGMDESVIRVFCQLFGLKQDDIAKALNTPLPANNQLDGEKALTSRRQTLIRLMVPELKCRALDDVMSAALAARFSNADPQILQSLLRAPPPATLKTTSQTSLEHLKGLLSRVREWLKAPGPGDAYFFPPATTNYYFLTGKKDGRLFIDHQAVEFVGNTKRVTASQSFRQGHSLLFSFTEGLSLQDLTWSTASGETQFNETVVCSVALATEACSLLGHFDRSLKVAKTLKLDADEVEFHQNYGAVLSNLNLSQLAGLQSFVGTRDRFKVSGAALIGYSRYLARARETPSPSTLRKDSKSQAQVADVSKTETETQALAQLIEETRQVTKLDREDISTFFEMEWPGASAKACATMLVSLDALQKLFAGCEMAKTLGVPIATLYQWARCPPVPSDVEEFQFVDDLQAAVYSGNADNALVRARESLRAKQQRVLQEYLLRMPALQDQGIRSADDLSAEFLIDVQTGPALQTSRIAQAIASVQLLVQRCLLGLEKMYGIHTDKIDRAQWNWMCKYTLWQANRKVFLYPENWLEPSLRDDKTQAFTELESKMMQTNLNKETIGQLLRDYVYAAHEVADLDVQSYLWEGTRGFRGNYHFFARTRAAPFVFYYRRLEVGGASAASVRWSWLPWTKMEVDIQTHEVNPGTGALRRPGSYLLPALFKGRLFLFIPQITLQTLPAKPASSGKSLYDTAKDASGPQAPTQYWEIKMAWTEMRNGKWSAKYVTATAVQVKTEITGPDGKVVKTVALPSISAFRFRLGSREAGGDQILQIYTDRWNNAATVTPNAGKKISGSFETLGCFEMQGPRVRLVDGNGDPSVGSSIDAELEFGRMRYNTAAKTGDALRGEVLALKTGTDSRGKSLLAVPDPDDAKGADYQLTWLLTFDSLQPYGASGLVVERATPSRTQSFFGFPTFDKDGNYDITLGTTVVTRTLTHAASLNLVEQIANKEGFETIFDALETLPADMNILAFGREGNTYNELAAPGSLYTWELGFHAIALLMERLLATQQFDLALDLSRMVFDPARDDASAPRSLVVASAGNIDPPKPLSRLDRCWRFVPFKWTDLRLAGSVRDIIQRLAPGPLTSTEILDWEANPFSPHTVARGRPAVYMKRFVMKCIEILIASGDQYFRQDSMEAIPLATQRYTEASELFGPAPVVIDAPTKPVNKSYADIKTLINPFATASVDLELDFPYFVNPFARGQQPKGQQLRDSTPGYVRSTYFGVPANPQMQALRDTIDDRLYKIRNGLDINGNPRRLPLFDPPIDPGQLIAALHSGSTLSSWIEGTQGPMPNYRARFLLAKAMALCAELRGFSDAYLTIKEKRDAEAMSSLRVRQEGGILALTAEIKEHQLQEAIISIESLEETRKSHVARLKFYLALVGETSDIVPTSTGEWVELQQVIGGVTKDELRMSPEEVLEMELWEDAQDTNAIATALEQSTSVLMALPEIVTQIEPMGVGTSVHMDGSIIAKVMMIGAGVIRAAAQASSDMASRASRKGQMIRQLQDRRMQANAAGRDIKVTDKQIAAQRKRIDGAKAELRAQQQQMADNAETEAYLRTKYTSEKLYAWLDIETRKLAYQAYLTALDMAKTTERAMSFEYGPRSQSFLSNAYWDESRDGLLAGTQLAAALQRMDKFYVQNATHDYELSKTISLRQVSPLALLNLRIHGVAEFDLLEILFDQDFPGHYCRRIKTVSVTVPSIVGPYTGVNCTLRLLEHRYRLKAGRSSAGSYYLQDAANDPRFHTDRVPISAIALSSGNQDSGKFELSFNDDRYVPFEGAGVISKWKLEFPGPYPQFDYRSISDVLVTIHYTALEGGALWKSEASDAVREFRSQLDQQLDGSSGAYLLFDLSVDFADEWRRFGTRIAAAPASDKPVTMDLSRLPNLLPFWSPRHATTVQEVVVAVQPLEGGWAADGEVKMLDRVLVEQDKSSDKLRLLGPPKRTPPADGSAPPPSTDVTSEELMKTGLSFSVIPKRFCGKVPQNCWGVVHFTRSK